MVIAAVHHGDTRVRPGETAGGGQAAEAGAQDEDVGERFTRYWNTSSTGVILTFSGRMFSFSAPMTLSSSSRSFGFSPS
jgi:hypothetical protein